METDELDRLSGLLTEVRSHLNGYGIGDHHRADDLLVRAEYLIRRGAWRDAVERAFSSCEYPCVEETNDGRLRPGDFRWFDHPEGGLSLSVQAGDEESFEELSSKLLPFLDGYCCKANGTIDWDGESFSSYGSVHLGRPIAATTAT